MFGKKSFDEGATRQDAVGSFALEKTQNWNADQQPTLDELRGALKQVNGYDTDRPGSYTGQEGILLCCADLPPPAPDFKAKLKDMDADTLEQLGQPDGTRFSPTKFNRI